MGTSYDRRINLYINGDEVQNNIKSIRAEMTKTINEQARMTVGSQEYYTASSKIKELKNIMAEHQEAISNTASAFDKLKDSALSLLPALSFAAVAEGIVTVFGKIKDSTKATAEAWDVAMAGMSSGISYLWRSMATGNFKDFFSNMNKAIEGGQRYAAMNQEIANNNRALRVIESNAMADELKYEEALKNKELSMDDRIAAGKARIKLEEDLSSERQVIANKQYQNEFDEASRITGLNEAQLISVASNIDKGDKLDAEEYNKKLENYNKLKALNVVKQASIYGEGAPIQAPDTQEMINLKGVIDSTKGSVKEYASFLKAYDTATEATQEKLTAAIVFRNNAINSAPENLKKVITRVHSLLAGQETGGGKVEDAATKAKLDSTDADNSKAMAAITKKHNEEKTSDLQYKSELLAQELTYLNQRKAIYAKGSKEYEDIEKQIQDKILAGGKDAEKAQLSIEEAKNKSAISLIDQKFISGKSTTAQYQAELLAQELKFGQDKMNVYQKGSKEYEDAQAQALDKQVKAEIEVKKLLLAAQKELATSETNNLKDEIAKKKALEEERFKEEITRLNSERQVKEKMSQDDIALNDTLDKIILAKTKAHNKAITDLDNSATDAKKITDLRDSIMHAQTKQQRFDDELRLAKVEYDSEFKAADGNRAKELDAEKKFNDKVKGIQEKQNESLKLISSAFVSFISDTFSGQIDQYETFGQSLILAALEVLKQLVPIWTAEIVAGSLATPESIMSGGVAGIIEFTALLAIMDGFISLAEAGVKSNIQSKKDAAQTKTNSTTTQTSTTTGYAGGGYTGDGDPYELAGVVHKGEYVIPKSTLRNPALKPLISMFESYRRNGRIPGIDLNPGVMNLSMNHSQTGTLSSFSQANPSGELLSRQFDKMNSFLERTDATLRKNNSALDKLHVQLQKPLSVNKYGHNGIAESIDDIARFKRLTQ